MSTLRKRDSKTLKRTMNPELFTGFYHATPTLAHQIDNDQVVFRNGGWLTPSTCKSQTFFLQDISLDNLRVGIQKGLAYLFVKNNKVPIARIDDGTVMSYRELEDLNERGNNVENRELRNGDRAA